METRTYTRTEVRVYKLILNPMVENVEACSLVAASTNYDRLVSWYNEQLTTPYRDGQWYKVFKEGSPLEWYNPAETELNSDSLFGQGIRDEWVDIETWNNLSTGYHHDFEIV